MGINTKRQKWEEFSNEDHGVWKILFERQIELLKAKKYVPDLFYDNLVALNFTSDKIPKIEDVNRILGEKNGIKIIFDNETVVGKNFFQLLRDRKFPSTMFIRDLQSLDYLTEPDIFHDLFGHCPFLYENDVADIIELVGIVGLKCLENKISTKYIGRLYWYTVEFGLLRHQNSNTIFGGGILSSFQESQLAIESPDVRRVNFNPIEMMLSDYDYNKLQTTYFIIDSISELKNFLINFDIKMIEDIKNNNDNSSLRIDEIKC